MQKPLLLLVYRMLRMLTLSLVVFTCTYLSGQETKPLILNEPADWRYEKIDLPLDFAPDIADAGFEELRFAPGMFDRSATTYFTYVFVLSFEDQVRFKKKKLKRFLLDYYRGLAKAVAGSREMTIDLSEITAEVQQMATDDRRSKSYHAEVVFLDVFNKGEPVEIHLEMTQGKSAGANPSFLLALASPQAKKTATWKQLHEIGDGVLKSLHSLE